MENLSSCHVSQVTAKNTRSLVFFLVHIIKENVWHIFEYKGMIHIDKINFNKMTFIETSLTFLRVVFKFLTVVVHYFTNNYH